MKFSVVSKIIKWGVALFFSSTILAVVAYRFIPVYITPLMVIRCLQQVSDGKSIKLYHHWVSLDNISPHLPVAVLASEDQRFFIHHAPAPVTNLEQVRYRNKLPKMCFFGQEEAGQGKALKFISQP